jgi:hypothetical protein
MSEPTKDQRAMAILESLTPGGGEFVGDPEACARWIRRVREMQLDHIRRLHHKLRNEDGIIQFLIRLSNRLEAERNER